MITLGNFRAPLFSRDGGARGVRPKEQAVGVLGARMQVNGYAEYKNQEDSTAQAR